MNSRLLCVSPRCRRDPDGNPIPRYAADGLRLCDICTNMVGEDALITAVRYRQLGLVLTRSGLAGEERTSRSKPDANLHLNLRAAALRRDIETTVGGLATLIARQRGFAWPTDVRVADRPDGFIGPMPLLSVRSVRLPVLARFVARSHQWLAAHEAADRHAGTLRELATGEPYRVAFPGGVRRFVLPGLTAGVRYLACPEEVDDGQGSEPCPGVLWTTLRRDGDYLPAEILCNHDETHQWPIRQWMKLGSRLRRRAEAAEGRVAA
jgi:hypothetical protein